MNMRVTAEISLLIHVDEPLQAEGQISLPRLESDPRTQRLVLVATGDIDHHFSAREPPLASTVNVGIGDLSETDVPADVDVPRVEIRADVVVMSVRLIGNAVH